jgi:hypothetical protein
MNSFLKNLVFLKITDGDFLVFYNLDRASCGSRTAFFLS